MTLIRKKVSVGILRRARSEVIWAIALVESEGSYGGGDKNW